MNDYLALATGIISAGVGGELFVRGVVGLARWARVSAAIIGATVAAFATSSPELSVGISAGLAGTPQISLGDALGSNVTNVALILGLTLVIGGIRASRAELKRDFSVALAVPLVIGLFAVDGVLSRVDGFLLLAMFWAWLIAVVVEVRKQRSAAQEVLGERRRWLAVVLMIIGLALLIAAGRLIVMGAKGIAVSLGLGEFIIGLLIVAVGTSVPELATAVLSKIRGHDEVGLGTILGSNIFNGLLIVGVVATICPIVVPWREVTIALVSGLLTVAVVLPTRQGMIERRQGILLVALYAIYIALALWQGG